MMQPVSSRDEQRRRPDSDVKTLFPQRKAFTAFLCSSFDGKKEKPLLIKLSLAASITYSLRSCLPLVFFCGF